MTDSIVRAMNILEPCQILNIVNFQTGGGVKTGFIWLWISVYCKNGSKSFGFNEGVSLLTA
jgi:hypothetical protein